MIGYDDPWIAACGKVLNGIFEYTLHKSQCDECLDIYFRDHGVQLHEENDADDRGICYEDD